MSIKILIYYLLQILQILHCYNNIRYNIVLYLFLLLLQMLDADINYFAVRCD